jgi:hypothetical protein
MVETGGSSKVADDHQKRAEQLNYRRENPLSVRERIQFYIDSAEARLQITLRDIENEPDVEALDKQISALIKNLKNTFKESSKQDIRNDIRQILRKIEKQANAPGDLRAMFRQANTALKLFEVGDIDRALIAYDHMHVHREKCNLPVNKSNEQSEFAKYSRRPQLPTRAVLCALRAGKQSKSEVEYFFKNKNRLSDKWGNFDVKTVKDGFELTDTDRNFSERTLKTDRLSTKISETKKRYND